MSRTLRLLLLAGTGLLAVACSGSDAVRGVRAVPAVEAASLLDDPATVILDIRTPPEVAQARLPGELVHLDFYEPDFAAQVAELDRDATYLLYCRSGNRSGQARAVFEQLGFSDVVDVSDGIIGWVDAGLPIEQG